MEYTETTARNGKFIVREYEGQDGRTTHFEVECPKLGAYKVYGRAECSIKLNQLEKQHKMLEIMEAFKEDMTQDPYLGRTFGIPDAQFENLSEKLVEIFIR